MIKEGSTHNLLICDPILHPGLYQVARRNSDPDVLEIIFTGGMGMIVIVFTQYNVCMRISFDLNLTEAPALDPLTVDLPFMRCLLHIDLVPASSVPRATECLVR